MQLSQYGTLTREQQGVEARAQFISRTYNHLFFALVAFGLIEIGLFQSGLATVIAGGMAQVSWLVILGGFMLTSWGATHLAQSARSLTAQYLGLGAYVVLQALIFVPLLYLANEVAPGTISSAALVSFVGFGALTGIVFYTRKDFSFLRAALIWGGVGALLLILASALFGLQLGTFFSVGMIVFAGAAILYDTSNVIHHYPEDRYVGAALALFASVALLFWYVLRLFLAARD